MLILTRRVNESIKIGDNIEVRVIGIERGQVKIAITAPNDVAVHREEIYNKVGSSRLSTKVVSREEMARRIEEHLKS